MNSIDMMNARQEKLRFDTPLGIARLVPPIIPSRYVEPVLKVEILEPSVYWVEKGDIVYVRSYELRFRDFVEEVKDA